MESRSMCAGLLALGLGAEDGRVLKQGGRRRGEVWYLCGARSCLGRKGKSTLSVQIFPLTPA